MAQPLCPYFGTCGGCTAQHIDYSLQIENKKRMLHQAIGFENIEVFTDKEYYYRNRIDTLFCDKGLCFRQKEPSKRILIETCPIANERINIIIKEINSFFTNNEKAFKYAVIRTAETASISFVVPPYPPQEVITKIEAFAKRTPVENIIVTYNNEDSISSDYFVVKGTDMLQQTLCGKKFFFSVQGFFQNNPIMAEKMQQYCHDIMKKYSGKGHLLDLYAGVGTFGIINAESFKTVTIVESVKECIDAAQKNIAENHSKNATALVCDAAHLPRLKLQKPLYVIADPPRSGMDMKTIQQLIELSPEVILYVSCNPQQLGKDVKKFKRYAIKSAALFDLFPETLHSEAVVELVKVSEK
ncbi:MAG: RsmD family RNA methyltransferase [Candidatus Woesearchaeota archaeon]|jgi:23S rRNA (uracil-5-)-methyltransferase RumA